MHSRFQAFTLLMLAASSPVLGAEQYRQPKIRAITAFVRIDGSQSLQPVQDALPFLRRAKDTFEKAGYQVQTIRITTQPFVQYSGGRSTKENLAFFKSLDIIFYILNVQAFEKIKGLQRILRLIYQ